eukprot:1437344-Rhodomonas_salina.1
MGSVLTGRPPSSLPAPPPSAPCIRPPSPAEPAHTLAVSVLANCMQLLCTAKRKRDVACMTAKTPARPATEMPRDAPARSPLSARAHAAPCATCLPL